MCMAKVALCCPNCKHQLVVTRPDSVHTCWSVDKPQASEVDADVVELVYDCKNPNCKAKFTVYWYETQVFLARA